MGAEIEADLGVVVHHRDYVTLAVEQARHRIGRVAFRGHAVVPVMIGIGGILKFDGLERWILAGRLIEVSVHAQLSLHRIALTLG